MAYDFSFEDQSSILSNPAAFLTGPQSRSVRLSGPPPSGEAWLPIMAGSVPGLSPIPAYSPSSSATSPFTPPDPLLELIYPGWPRDLPPPELTHRLVEVFFSRPHQCIGIVDAARIRAAMRLPPTSSAFPHTALLHVMCAIACLMVPDDFFRGEAPYWGTAKPGDYHVARCKVRPSVALSLRLCDRPDLGLFLPDCHRGEPERDVAVPHRTGVRLVVLLAVLSGEMGALSPSPRARPSPMHTPNAVRRARRSSSGSTAASRPASRHLSA